MNITAPVNKRKKTTTGYCKVPLDVLRDKQLSLEAKAIYSILTSYAWQSDECWPSMGTLSEDAGVRRKTVGKYLKELRDAGYIEWRRRGHTKTNIYQTKKIASDVPAGVHHDVPAGIHHTNIEINKQNNNSRFYKNKTEKMDFEKVLNEYNPVIKHKPNLRIFEAIRKSLKTHTLDDLIRIIKNYKTILLSENYWFTYKWTLIDFLSRGARKFEDLKVAENNFKKKDTRKNKLWPGQRFQRYSTKGPADKRFNELLAKAVALTKSPP